MSRNAQNTECRGTNLSHSWWAFRQHCINNNTHSYSSHRAESHGNATMLLHNGADKQTTNSLQYHWSKSQQLPSSKYPSQATSGTTKRHQRQSPKSQLHVEECAWPRSTSHCRLGQCCSKA